MRSTPCMPPIEDVTTSNHDNDNEIIFVCENFAVTIRESPVKRHKATPSPRRSGSSKTPAATTSLSGGCASNVSSVATSASNRADPIKTKASKESAEGNVGVSEQAEKQTTGKKRDSSEISSDCDEERLISEELKMAAEEGQSEEKAAGSQSSPRKHIRFSLFKDFEVGYVQKLTARARTSAEKRFRTLIRDALRGLHGENAVVPMSHAEACRLNEEEALRLS
ncbi:uncharacterized protein MEPE_02009 [Melanopsichium pennsylvanicum]|uniref:Uncharacterized protein n=2 Tax=Melanopsichium pennsylvanicum TaxID=63383 RepID=A0AAJ4XJ26_9BASI|nr:uncharacterized protein BN887_01673 [Melanopsichium pennsylvanicum 4]SNX83302.1 uncharacterized protein MEPE_02009 [Melanopsichium pennsylvanicum]